MRFVRASAENADRCKSARSVGGGRRGGGEREGDGRRRLSPFFLFRVERVGDQLVEIRARHPYPIPRGKTRNCEILKPDRFPISSDPSDRRFFFFLKLSSFTIASNLSELIVTNFPHGAAEICPRKKERKKISTVFYITHIYTPIKRKILDGF